MELEKTIKGKKARIIEIENTPSILCDIEKEYFEILDDLKKQGFKSKFEKARAQLTNLYALLPEDELTEIKSQMNETEKEMLESASEQGYDKELLKDLLEEEAKFDDYSNPLLNYIKQFCKIAIKNKFGRKAIFTKDDIKIHILKMYLIKDELLDEIETLDNYALTKIYQIFTGHLPELPNDLNEENFLNFWQNQKLDLMLEIICDDTLSKKEYSEVFKTYSEELKQKLEENLIKDTETYKIFSNLIVKKINEAIKKEKGIFKLKSQTDEQVNEKIQYASQDIEDLLHKIDILSDEMKISLYHDDVGVAFNRTFMFLKSRLRKQPELAKIIDQLINECDDRKEDLLQRSNAMDIEELKNKQSQNFFEDIKVYRKIIEKLKNI